MLAKKISLIFASLCVAGSAFAADAAKEIKLVSAAPHNDTVMLVTYKICDAENAKCSPEFTAPVSSGIPVSVLDMADKRLNVVKVIEKKGNDIIAETASKTTVCSGVFGVDSVLLFNNYHTKNVICTYGYTL